MNPKPLVWAAIAALAAIISIAFAGLAGFAWYFLGTLAISSAVVAIVLALGTEYRS